MQHTSRNIGVVAVLVALAVAGCGSSNGDDGPVAAPATTVASSQATDEPAADALVDAVNEPPVDDVYLDLKLAMSDFDQYTADLPSDAQATYAELKLDVAHAEEQLGAPDPEAYATVKDDIDLLHDQIDQSGSDDLSAAVIDSWNRVKQEFDQIDAGI